MPENILTQFARALTSGEIRVVDLSQPLDATTAVIQLPPEFGKSWPFRLEEISKYDDRGPAWYWNNFSCGEHTGTHFDAPIHWVTGKDFDRNATDTIAVDRFFAPACVIDVSKEVAANPDFLLTPKYVEGWEAKHGRIEAGSWVLMRTDWSKRSDPAAFLNIKEDGAHVPGPDPELVPFLAKQRDVDRLGLRRRRHRRRPGLPFPAAIPMPHRSCTAAANSALPASPISISFRRKARF